MRRIDQFGILIEEVRQISKGHYDETLPVQGMEFESLEQMYIMGAEVEVLPSAQRLFANKLHVPYSYLARCSKDLQAQNLNYWIKQEALNRDSLFCRFDGAKLRAVFTDRYKVMDNVDVVENMQNSGFKDNDEVHYNLDENMLVVKVPDYTKTFGLSGDNIVPGISFANSEVGILAFSIEAYFYRLVCSNGLIAATAVESKFKHISFKAIDSFSTILRRVVQESQHSQEKFRISLTSEVTNPLSTIASFNKQFQLTKDEGQVVEESWSLEAGFTMFHVINAYTRAAQDKSLGVEESVRLERVGGLILKMVRK
ncbi:MAG: DUF932 domain-containing protein [Deltaproteobacteria bacterium]|nr:DUF932 domain-containing protein [Deltaproteobacteria bacterium]